MAVIGRARRVIAYHGRSGRPVIHETADGRRFIMVRAKGGGTKRIYHNSKYRENGRVKRLNLR